MCVHAVGVHKSVHVDGLVCGVWCVGGCWSVGAGVDELVCGSVGAQVWTLWTCMTLCVCVCVCVCVWIEARRKKKGF